MLNTKLVQILAALSPREFKSFEQYVASPYFNRNKQVGELLDIIKPFHPTYDNTKFTREYVFTKLFGKGQPFNEAKLRYVLSDLTLLLESFLSVDEFLQNPQEQKYFLVKSLRERNMDKYFLQHLEEAHAQNNKPGLADSDFYFYNYLFNEQSYLYTSVKNNRSVDSSLQELIDNLEIFYLAKNLKYYCEIINRQNILSVNYKLSIFEKIIPYLQERSFEEYPVIHIYVTILKTLTETDHNEDYDKLMDLVALHASKFPSNEVRDMYAFAQNYCIKQINSGNTNFLRKLFELNKTLLATGLIFESGYLSPHDFKNIVTVALRLEEFEFAHDFIQNQKDRLDPAIRENAYTFSLAWYHFFRKEYDKTLKTLLRVEFTDVYYHLDAKSLLLKTYYELNEEDALYSLFDAFKIYLRRNKLISDYQREVYSNLIGFTRRLVTARHGSNRVNPEELKKEIQETKKVADINWLLSKVEELEKKK
jgi:hypothetical protein